MNIDADFVNSFKEFMPNTETVLLLQKLPSTDDEDPFVATGVEYPKARKKPANKDTLVALNQLMMSNNYADWSLWIEGQALLPKVGFVILRPSDGTRWHIQKIYETNCETLSVCFCMKEPVLL